MSIDRLHGLIGSLQSLYSSVSSLLEPLARVPRRVLLILAGALVVGFVAVGIWWFWHTLPLGVWLAAAGLVTSACVVWLAFRGIPAMRQRRFIQAAGKDGRPSTAGIAPLQIMDRRLREAQDVIRNSADFRRGHRTLYRIPWFLFLGDEAAAAQTLLAAGLKGSAVPPPDLQGERVYWSWWFYRGMVAIEMDPGIVSDNKDPSHRQIWYHALKSLLQHRSRLPLNGIVLCVAAERLLGSVDHARELGLRFRQIVDEAMKFFEISLPVYVIVTGLDRLDGAGAFLGALPAVVLDQAVGYRLGPEDAGEAHAEVLAARVVDELAERLHAIRLTALRAARDDGVRRDVYMFVEAVAALRPGLEMLVKHLFEDNPWQQRGFWRGLYFTATGAPPSFATDLFARFLPTDQPLARRSRGARATGVLGLMALLAFLIAVDWFAWSFIRSTSTTETTAVAAAETACLGWSEGEDEVFRAHKLIDCRDKLYALEATTRSLVPLPLPRASVASEQDLKQRFTARFRSLVLLSGDAGLDDASRPGFGHCLAIAQSLRVLQDCRAAQASCPTEKEKHKFVFTEELLPWLARAEPAEIHPGESRPALAEDLFVSLVAYARWIDDDVHEEERRRSAQRLARLLDRGAADPPEITAWADRHHAPVLASDFWRTEATQGRKLPADRDVALSAAFSRRFRDDVLGPFLATASGVAPGAASDVETAYRQAQVAAWEVFLRGFPDARTIWRGDAAGLLAVMTKRDAGPYVRLWAAIRTDLLGDDGDLETLPAGLRALALDLAETWPAMETEFGQLVADLATDRTGQSSHNLVRDLFRQWNEPKTKAGQRFLSLWETARHPPEALQKSISENDRTVWAVFVAPVSLVLELALSRAADFLQTNWQQEIIFPLQGITDDKLAGELRNEKGIVATFVRDRLQPFLDETSTQPVRHLDLSMPFTAEFRNFLSNLRAFQLTVPQARTVRGTVRVVRSTLFGGQWPEGAAGTRVALNCVSRVFTASSKPQAGTDVETPIVWSDSDCIDVRIEISLPDSIVGDQPGAPAPAAILRFNGPDGFREFARAFRGGSQMVRVDRILEADYGRNPIVQLLQQWGMATAQVFVRVALQEEPLPPRRPPALPPRIVEIPIRRDQL
jgi:hypothetical protein